MDERYADAPSQEMKHLSIIHAISRLGEVRNQADKLLVKINGEERGKEPQSVGENMPTLSNTISSSGNAIADLSEQISSILTGIDSELF
jgi:hypothetical protein